MFTYTKYMIEANRLPVEFMTEDLYHSDLVDDILGIKTYYEQQMARVFKARMILYAAYGHCVIREDGNYYEHPHWFELAKDK